MLWIFLAGLEERQELTKPCGCRSECISVRIIVTGQGKNKFDPRSVRVRYKTLRKPTKARPSFFTPFPPPCLSRVVVFRRHSPLILPGSVVSYLRRTTHLPRPFVFLQPSTSTRKRIFFIGRPIFFSLHLNYLLGHTSERKKMWPSTLSLFMSTILIRSALAAGPLVNVSYPSTNENGNVIPDNFMGISYELSNFHLLCECTKHTLRHIVLMLNL